MPEEPEDRELPAAGPARPPARMEADLRALLATVREPHLRALLDALLGPGTESWARFREAPAAKRYHQAYRHGLLEHTLTVAEGVSALAATFPGIDRDLAVTGAILHDIGKLDAYTFAAPPSGAPAEGEGRPPAGTIELTDDGRLQGEIALGYFKVRGLIERIDGFSPLLAQSLLHIVLSHHGSLAHGSPVVPVTREATLVHMVDNLGGRLGSFDRLQRELPEGERWSQWDRVIGAGAWFPPAPDAPDAGAQPAPHDGGGGDGSLAA